MSNGLLAQENTMKSACSWKAIAVALLLLACGRGALAQQAQLTGRNADKNDATIAGAVVKVTNISTGVTQQTETNGEGLFTAPFLQPGSYRVTVEAAGFKSAARDGLKLNIVQVARTDFALEPDEVAETAQVSSDPFPKQRRSPSAINLGSCSSRCGSSSEIYSVFGMCVQPDVLSEARKTQKRSFARGEHESTRICAYP
jgi:hypothetical protein